MTPLVSPKFWRPNIKVTTRKSNLQVVTYLINCSLKLILTKSTLILNLIYYLAPSWNITFDMLFS